jgi:hypothetical protein
MATTTTFRNLAQILSRSSRITKFKNFKGPTEQLCS